MEVHCVDLHCWAVQGKEMLWDKRTDTDTDVDADADADAALSLLLLSGQNSDIPDFRSKIDAGIDTDVDAALAILSLGAQKIDIRHFRSRTPIPLLLTTCRESRKVALSGYLRNLLSCPTTSVQMLFISILKWIPSLFPRKCQSR